MKERGWRTRLALPADLPALVNTEQVCFAQPWSRETFEGLLTRSGVHVVVLEAGASDPAVPDPPPVVGHGILWVISPEAEILNLAVRPDLQGRGGGGVLLDALLNQAAEAEVHDLHLEVRVSNASARALYARRGFEPVGRRPGYYENPREDALLLRRSLEIGSRKDGVR